jgi:hypothetical protein
MIEYFDEGDEKFIVGRYAFHLFYIYLSFINIIGTDLSLIYMCVLDSVCIGVCLSGLVTRWPR